ncbi:MAG: methyltransferase regulatory domain-containing protein [Myxococcales bacterium]|nr:methyltransferase regulatory domain-containing protein [Myxococcales bacterium]
MIYDDFPYDDFPFRPTHPDALGTIAGLFGLEPAPSEACRVLELGCGLGGNLLAMAASLPESRFVGMDLSAVQIEHARAEAEALGLTNLEFFVGDIQALSPALGTFDYIICHGVWSWVPPAVQEAIFRLCRELLQPRGVAFISYNVLPGWYFRGALRQLMLRAVPAEGSPAERAAAARAYIQALGEHAPVQRSVAAQLLKSEVDLIRPLSDRYLFHEHLAEHNHAVWFTDFAARAAGHGLQYLGDAELHGMIPERYGDATAAWVRRGQPDQVTMESRLDELGLRFFRRSLLCHAEVELDRSVGADELAGHWITTQLTPNSEDVDLEPDVPATFTAPDGFAVSTSGSLLKAALYLLDTQQPRGLRLEELTQLACGQIGEAFSGGAVVKLTESLLELLTQGYVEVCRAQPRFVLKAGRRPRTTPMARRQAAQGRDGIFNQRHVSVAIDRMERAMLPLLDGRTDRAALTDAMFAAVQRGDFEVSISGEPVTARETLAEVVDAKLDRLGRMALLIG